MKIIAFGVFVVVWISILSHIHVSKSQSHSKPHSSHSTGYCQTLYDLDVQSNLLYADDSFKRGGACYNFKG